MAVLEWGSSRTYDWRAGLHAAGSLLSYEKLSPALALASPALLMRNTTDDPEWPSWMYHDHVSWFAGSGYVVEKVLCVSYAHRPLAFQSGTVMVITLSDSDVVRPRRVHPLSHRVLRRHLPYEAGGLDAKHRGRDRHQHGGRS